MTCFVSFLFSQPEIICVSVGRLKCYIVLFLSQRMCQASLEVLICFDLRQADMNLRQRSAPLYLYLRHVGQGHFILSQNKIKSFLSFI